MYDLVIRGGTVHDGLGSPARLADVAIEGELVAAVGEIRSADPRSPADAFRTVQRRQRK